MATIGEQLTAPEEGWRRLDDRSAQLRYIGTWSSDATAGTHNGTGTYSTDLTARVLFKFKGTKIRLIGFHFTNKTTAGVIKIDGVAETFNEYGSTLAQVLIYEKQGLSNTDHDVEISFENGQLYIDAIDIDVDATFPKTYPATRGVLRTKIEDMSIGDYIPFWVTSFEGGTPCQIAQIGGDLSGKEEIPTWGSALPNGVAYAVKVDTGLLISDRVVQHTITWDRMNTSKMTEGKTIYAHDGNIVPLLPSGGTSDVGPDGGSVIYSSQYTNGVEAARNVFSAGLSGYWNAGASAPAWIGYVFSEPQVVNVIQFEAPNGGLPASSVTVEVTLNGTTWTALQTFTGLGATFAQTIRFDNEQPYLGYRLRLNALTANSWVALVRPLVFARATKQLRVRSISGGVTHATADGEMSLTDHTSGGWPISNEWDQYIANFPLALVADGKSIDDVFHWINCTTWTQETPVIGFTRLIDGFVANSLVYRIYRGHDGGSSKLNGVSVAGSNHTNQYVGFRPVFEYKEG